MGNLVDTGLGWYADNAWLANQAVNIGTIVKPTAANVNAAGEYLATISFGGRAYYKTNNGPAYLFVSTTGQLIVGGYSVNWMLLGTSQEAVAVTGSGAGTAQLTIYGETWYRTAAYWGHSLTGYNQAAFVDVIPDGSYTEQQFYEMCVDYIGGYPGTRQQATDLALRGSIIDTGLGWSADSDYLVYTGGMTFASITAGVWGTRTFKKVTDGYAISVFVNDGWEYTGPLTISTNREFAEQIINDSIAPSTQTLFFLGRTWYYSSQYWLLNGDVEEVTNLNIPTYNAGWPSDIDTLVQNVITAAGVVVTPTGKTVAYNKSTAGYSVTCMCKWRTSYGGDVYCSPVLISSQPNNTLYTRNGSTPSVNTTEHQYGGMTFYMRKAPFDTLDGSETITTSYPIVDLSGVAQTNDTIFAAIAYQSSLGVGYIPGDEDPYAGGGTSEPGGGGGSFDNTSDQIDDSTTPVFSFAGSGFCRIYNPNLSQLQNLANYLWTDTSFLQTIVNHAKQLLEDPIEAVISLAMLPVSIPQGTSETVKVLFISTGVSMPPATTQYVEVDCGTYALEEYYGSALDYNPYTQVDLFLPFIGQVSLNTDEVMGHTIGVKYRVDIVSGLCVAKVFVDNDCMYQFSGNCAIFMPLNSADFSSYLSAAMTAATALVSAGAGMAAGAAAAGAEAVAEPAIQTGGNLLTSGESLVTPQMALQYRVEESVRPMYSPSGGEGSPASFGEMERKFINNSAAAVMGSKISFEHASHLAGNSGILGVRRPYLIINRPDMCNPEKYGKYNGRPCMMYLYLGNLTGYTEVQEIQLTGFSATNPELSEISKMLKGGVIF